jgi:hypothetical protein
MSNTLQKDQRGLVSFMITIIMMLVISLIVIGFTQVTNRNRREQLDRQLSTQAFYAAESGVNAAATIVKADFLTPTGVATQDTCDGTTYPATSLNSDSSVGYTCVLVNPTVPSIVTNANPQTSSVFPLNPVDSDGNAVAPTQLTFTWSAAQGKTASNSGCQTSAQFPKNDSTYTCAFGLLRVDLMMGSGGGSATAFANNTISLFMQPLASGSSPQTITNFSSPKGIIVGAQYNSTDRTYTATVPLAAAAQSTQYYVRITTLYYDSPRIVVDGTNASGGISFKDAQAIIDATGKAQDVLRRVQVTVPLQQYSSVIPEGAVQSTASVCKQFSTYSGYYQSNCP